MNAVHKPRRHPATLGGHGTHRTRRSWAAFAAAVVAAVVVAVTVFSVIDGAAGTAPSASAATTDISTVQALYAQDLVSRINAERVARTTFGMAIPPLQVDPSLAAYAQGWSAHLAATGTVADPPLSTTCGSPSTPLCIMAANSGSTGNGYWPGDGSDGMDGLYMASAPHRQNLLGAAYTEVGVGVTCSAGRAWTVEVFGYTYGGIAAAVARQNTQNAVQGQPVPAAPVVAGAPSRGPGLLPGSDHCRRRSRDADRGAVPLSLPGGVGGRRAQPAGPDRGDGRHGRRQRVLVGPHRRVGLRPRRRGQLRVDGRRPAQRARRPHRGHRRRPRLLDGRVRRRHLRLRRRRLLRLDGRDST